MSLNRFEEEHQKTLQRIQNKIDGKLEISPEEQRKFCNCLYPYLLKKYPICDDVRFYKFFLQHFAHKNNEIGYSIGREQELNGFLREWEPKMEKTNHSSSFMQDISKETREEIKALKKKGNEVENSPAYNEKKREILLYSKFVYIKVKKAFEHFKNKEATVTLNNKEIQINEYSLVHIIFRHYANAQKQYISDKSFFTDAIGVEEILDRLLDILIKIENSGVYVNDSIMKIYIEYYSTKYTIYCKKIQKQKKGVGNYTVYRLNTFYPVESSKELLDIKDNYDEKEVTNNLSVFIKK